VVTGFTFAGTSFSFAFASETGYTYEVQYKDSLNAVSWSVLQSVPGTGGSIPVTDSPVSSAARFYRVVCLGAQ
jgi:hypothetical protein